jgi:cytochrome c oxidase subunit 1
MDPQQAAGFKLFHTLGTFGVAIPTFMTGFTIIASLEIAGRLRGGKGLFGWIAALDWGNPLVLATIFAMLFLVLGGFGGVVNASYGLNTLIHNTAWVTAHFHLILAGTTIILYMAGTYAFWPKLTGRQLASRKLAVVQLWLWFIGMVVTTSPWHVLGLLGLPRRISSVVYSTALTAQWQPYQAAMAIGGSILTLAAVLFFVILVRTRFNPAVEVDREMAYAEPIHPVLSVPGPLNGFALWNWVLVVWMIAAFAYPIAQFFIMPTFEAVAHDA